MHDELTQQPPIGDTARATRRRQRSRGQSLVEFAVMLPVLVAILAFAADFGRAFTAYIAVTSAAREGAVYGMQSKENAGKADMIKQMAQDESGQIWGVYPDVVSTLATDGSYQKISVTVTYKFKPLIPYKPIPNSVSMKRTVTMRVLN